MDTNLKSHSNKFELDERKKVFITETIWIVSYYSDENDIVVTAFNNKEAAKKCYTYFKNEYDVCAIDECPTYKHFIITD